MAEPAETPSAWIGREVHIRYVDGDSTDGMNCTLEEVNDRGVRASAGDSTWFYPWSNIVKIGLGHETGRGTTKTRFVR